MFIMETGEPSLCFLFSVPLLHNLGLHSVEIEEFYVKYILDTEKVQNLPLQQF